MKTSLLLILCIAISLIVYSQQIKGKQNTFMQKNSYSSLTEGFDYDSSHLESKILSGKQIQNIN